MSGLPTINSRDEQQYVAIATAVTIEASKSHTCSLGQSSVDLEFGV
jgi:hypothetical protein